MKNLNFLIPLAAFIMVANAFGQNSVTLSFSGINGTTYYPPDSIKVKNITRNCDTVLYYPDTLLIFNYTGIGEVQNPLNGFKIMQNYPNPVSDRTTINVFVPEKDMVCLYFTDIIGCRLFTTKIMLDEGCQSFSFTPADVDLYLVTASWRGKSNTIRVLNTGRGSGSSCSLEYLGKNSTETQIKSTSAIQEFIFSPGDELMLIGFADTLESGFSDCPVASQDYVFQFTTNIPCPGADSLNYEGQWYHTIQIFSQCWMVENMNAGIMITSAHAQMNNDTIEKYCMGNDEYYCNIMGGLYFWDEMMKYSNVTGGQGICPEGWHVPSDLDWQILEGSADSVYKIGSPEWGTNNWRGTDAGGTLKQTGTAFWANPNTGATNSFGFTALPGGYFIQNSFWGIGYKAFFWSSQAVQKYYRNMDWDQARIQRNNNTGGTGAAFSVRCLRN